MPDPMVLYRKLTSGDEAGITAVRKALTQVRASLRAAADGITEGATTAATHWRGDARTEFLTDVSATVTDTAEVYRRLRTVDRVLAGAATAYGDLHRSADSAIRPWRAAGNADPALALSVQRNLLAARYTYESRLGTLATHLDPGSSDWTDLTHVGPGQPWIPQGLAYRADRDQLLVTSYNESKDADSQSRLTLVDNATGEEQKHVDLGGLEYSGPAGQPATGAPPNHAGGVATHGDNVWVTSTVVNDDGTQTSQVYVYSQKAIDRAQPGATVHPTQVINVPASSYITYADGKLWIGQYATDGDPKLYSFNTGKDGSIKGVTPTGEPDPYAGGDVPGEYPTPQHVQGVVVRDDQFVFSQSDGESGSSFITQDRDYRGFDLLDPDTWDARDEYRLGDNADGDPIHGVEEIEEIDGEIVTVHESGADKYDDDGHDHHDDITRTPLTELGLDSGDGYQTDPDALTEAAGQLDGSAEKLQNAADVTGGLQLVAHVLGDVPAAGPFSAAVTRYLADRGQELGTGAQSLRDTADGLIAGADTYRRLEDFLTAGFGGTN
ncbi:WXG100 family type VII secretion target [Labedaea rhizosphaerae]|uniref:Excreted virulence factor EspC (Type VII ESX diderm) n=1 Tax=Labedaea rhizosphaerae TaxID=598644 RepID=A0A4R6S920_LABRH|nr:type VII secretion target [Labedaea rhizosphaerae]TDP96281.1 excreted virulence factor EspC (type VII ESX diderm) [Labedaea rhizosphaerae]